MPALSHTHTYTTDVTAPTCTQQGYTTYTCACGDSYKDTYLEPLEHDFAGGSCTVCGQKDSSTEPTQTEPTQTEPTQTEPTQTESVPTDPNPDEQLFIGCIVGAVMAGAVALPR